MFPGPGSDTLTTMWEAFCHPSPHLALRFLCSFSFLTDTPQSPHFSFQPPTLHSFIGISFYTLFFTYLSFSLSLSSLHPACCYRFVNSVVLLLLNIEPAALHGGKSNIADTKPKIGKQGDRRACGVRQLNKHTTESNEGCTNT